MQQRATWIDKLAWAMDSTFRVPGTNLRFGWDAILGLIPGAGEWVTSVLQAALVVGAVRHGNVPASVALRMVLNVAVDGAVGAIPFFGDIFDVFFKANMRNLRLLQRVRDEQASTGRIATRPHVLYLVGIVGLLFTILLLSGIAAFFVARWLFSLLAAN